MSSQVEKVVQIFKTLAQNPAVVSGRILNADSDKLLIYSIWTQRNLDRGKNIRFQQSYIVDTTVKSVQNLLPIDITSESKSSVSKSSQFRAVIREKIPEKINDPQKHLLEIWKWSQLYKTFDLGVLDIHGNIYTDDEFGCLEWSPCEQKLIYVAEKKVKSEPFYKIKPDDNGSISEDKKPTKGEEYVYKQDWGEELVGKCCPVAVVCDIETGQITVVSGIPEHFSVGQLTWAPDGSIVGVAWENNPRKLGLIHCTNRKSYIFHLTTDGRFSTLSEDRLAVRSPRFSPDNKYLVWLERPAGGPHHGAHSLVRYTWENKEKVTVIDRIMEKTTSEDGEVFYGLYNLELPKRCFIDHNKIVLSTPQKFVVNLYLIDLDNGIVKRLNKKKGSFVALDVYLGRVLCVHSSIQKPGCIIVGTLTGEEVKWVPVSQQQIPEPLMNFDVEYLDLQSETDDKCTNFNATYFGPKSGMENKVPLIVWPHGGPHSCFSDAYSLYTAFFASLGFAQVRVNYRGSTGQGQSNVEFLCGRVGDVDVKDVHQTTRAVCKQFSCIDPDGIVLFGGSHGGFLVTHLSGQFPDFYKAVVARNPVIDIGSLLFVSDIPDWSAVEAGYTYGVTEELDLNSEQWTKMRESSPLHYAKQVKAPTLLLIGSKDLRVPFSQGILYYHTLKALDTKTKLLIYEDSHSLSKVPVETDALINSMLWFLESLENK